MSMNKRKQKTQEFVSNKDTPETMTCVFSSSWLLLVVSVILFKHAKVRVS